jgi:hypothetical protein
VIPGDLLGQLTDVVETREVGDVGLEVRVPGVVPDLGFCGTEPSGISSVQQQLGSAASELDRERARPRALDRGRRSSL